MGKTVYDLILDALDSLSADQLERFKHKLSARQEIGYGLIEKVSNMAVTQRIINKFTKKDAIAHTATVLREIDLRDQAEDLEEAYARQGASSVAGMGDTGGRASDPSFTQTEVPARAQSAVSAAAGRTDKQNQLEVTQRKSQQGIQEREKKLQDLRQAADSLTRSAQAAVEDSERIFTELIRSFERRRSEVKELIRDQGKAAVSQAERLIEQLEQEIAELRRRDAELEQLSHTEDHIHFLQSCQSVCDPPGPGDLPKITVNPHVSFEALRKQVSELKERLEDVCKGELVKISQTAEKVHILELRTRESFLQYSCQLTLDPNTANTLLHLSEGNRQLEFSCHS
ncbi:hypothetical protein AAFF_G00266800 [Aldrovandia affinis]|uniref:Pyrin domain-containing protein n=1 Tax=Aldrovandia affinis TaxID=143900 RepID=A0AAD7RB65_9TELE|nr:hypothetical protein AAFF_G00266800 [Aldrovandia affinis]